MQNVFFLNYQNLNFTSDFHRNERIYFKKLIRLNKERVFTFRSSTFRPFPDLPELLIVKNSIVFYLISVPYALFTFLSYKHG